MMNMNYYGFGKGDLKIHTGYAESDSLDADYSDKVVLVTHIPTGKYYEATGAYNVPQNTLFQKCLDELHLMVIATK